MRVTIKQAAFAPVTVAVTIETAAELIALRDAIGCTVAGDAMDGLYAGLCHAAKAQGIE